MPLTFRRIAPVLLVACLGLIAGCGSSNNKGKIVGKWKIAGGSPQRASARPSIPRRQQGCATARLKLRIKAMNLP